MIRKLFHKLKIFFDGGEKVSNRNNDSESKQELSMSQVKEIVSWFSLQLENNTLERPACTYKVGEKVVNASPFFLPGNYKKSEIEKAFHLYIISTPDPVAALLAKDALAIYASSIVPDWLEKADDISLLDYYHEVIFQEKERISKDVEAMIELRKDFYDDDLSALGSMPRSEIT